MKRIVVERFGEAIVKEVEIPKINDRQALVRMDLSCICSQTDSHIIEGKYPFGNLPYYLGHEGAGTIVETGKNVEGFSTGDRVAVFRGDSSNGCLAEYTALPPHYMTKVPNSVSIESAAMFELAATVYSLVCQCVHLGDSVMIIGQGAAGSFATTFSRLAGATRIVVSEPIAKKRERSRKFGAEIALDPANEDIIERSMEITSGRGFDVVMDFAGTPESFASTVYLVRQQGTIGLFGINCEPIRFDFLEFHLKFAKLLSTGYKHAYDISLCNKMLDFELSGLVNFSEIITHKYLINDFPQAMEMIKNKDESVLRVALMPNH